MNNTETQPKTQTTDTNHKSSCAASSKVESEPDSWSRCERAVCDLALLTTDCAVVCRELGTTHIMKTRTWTSQTWQTHNNETHTNLEFEQMEYESTIQHINATIKQHHERQQNKTQTQTNTYTQTNKQHTLDSVGCPYAADAALVMGMRREATQHNNEHNEPKTQNNTATNNNNEVFDSENKQQQTQATNNKQQHIKHKTKKVHRGLPLM